MTKMVLMILFGKFCHICMCVWYCILKIIREVIDVHSGELAKLWREDREEETKISQHSHR